MRLITIKIHPLFDQMLHVRHLIVTLSFLMSVLVDLHARQKPQSWI